MKNHKAEDKKAKAAEAPECAPGPATQAEAAAGELEKQRKLAEDYFSQLQRLQADFENYRKRVEKEKPDLIKYGKADILIRLLPLYDLLLSAHNHINGARESGGSEDLLKGLEMIFKEFSRVFEAEELRPMEPVGKPYDPMACEILGVVEGTDENDGLVTEELQKGFWYGDKILRTAKVKIAKKKAAPAPEPEQPQEGKPEEEGQ
ncbi:MAG TPA: nucleotide exchange factor GrpE [Elusimicrobia bacterium]|nr:MAG: nucleotide exchange factor GrpE [Elusimicrobia bacterium GWD2_63_28]HCC48906.1 nucleotide exchange factor GrpE [Elusimicrobiota bacterium]